MKPLATIFIPHSAMTFSQDQPPVQDSSLLDICAAGDLDRARELLAQGAEIGFDSEATGSSPWEKAVALGHLELLQLLLNHHVEKQSDRFWRRLLNIAVRSGREPIVSFVLSASAQVDYTRPSAKSPLFVAVNLNRLDLVELLVQHNLDIAARDPMDRTLLHTAAMNHGNEDIVSLLLTTSQSSLADPTAWVNAVDRQQNTALHYAAEYSNADMVGQLISAGVQVDRTNSKLQTVLHYAVMNAQVEIVELLLIAGQANANAKDFKGNASLHYVASMDFTNLDYVDEDDVEDLQTQIAELLLTHGADPNECNDVGDTPLLLTIRNEYERLVTLLLALGADANRQSPSGGAALHEAARTDAMRPIWDVLLAYQANPNCKDAQGRTPLDLVLDTDRRQELQTLLAV